MKRVVGRRVRVLPALWMAMSLVACTNRGATVPAPDLPTWRARHGDSVASLNAALDAARATLSSLQRPDILGSCNQLRDSLEEARKAPPVPEPGADEALRAGLDAVGVGTEDCIRGAQGPNITQLEKSFRELREARALMDVANRRIEA